MNGYIKVRLTTDQAALIIKALRNDYAAPLDWPAVQEIIALLEDTPVRTYAE